MDLLTIMEMSKTLSKLIQTKGYKIKVNENSFLVFESKEQYKNIKRLEKTLFNIVNYVLTNGINEEVYEREEQRELKIKTYCRCGCENEYESESESDKLLIYNWALKNKIYLIESKVNKFPLTEANIFELEKNENLDYPFEIKFPTLVYFFMTKHKKKKVIQITSYFVKKSDQEI